MDMELIYAEPDYSLLNALFVVVAFAAYFIGIVIRRVVIPGSKSLSLSYQMLLGIPVSLMVVSPLLPVLSAATLEPPVFLVTVGVIMEHGMVVNETATYHLNKLKGELGHARSGSRRRKPVSIT